MTDNDTAIDPDHSVLLVMDFQPTVLDRLPDVDDLLSRVADAITTARSRGVQVGYVRVGFDDADYAAIPATNKALARLAGGGLFRSEAPETAVHERVAPQPGDIVVRKTRVGAEMLIEKVFPRQARVITIAELPSLLPDEPGHM